MPDMNLWTLPDPGDVHEVHLAVLRDARDDLSRKVDLLVNTMRPSVAENDPTLAKCRRLLESVNRALTAVAVNAGTHIVVADDAWEPCGADFEDRTADQVLHAKFQLNDTMMHLTAFEVWTDRDGVQHPYQAAADFHMYASAAGPDGPFYQLDIGGRSYVVFAEPFCN